VGRSARPAPYARRNPEPLCSLRRRAKPVQPRRDSKSGSSKSRTVLLVAQLLEELFNICVTRRLVAMFTRARQLNSIHALHMLSSGSILILSYHPPCASYFLFNSGLPTKILIVSHNFHTCYVPYPSPSP